MSLQDKYRKQTLTLGETAVELGVTVSDVESIIEEGELKVKKFGSKTIVPVIALESFLSKDLEESPAQSYHTEPTSREKFYDIHDKEDYDEVIRILGQGSFYMNKDRHYWNGTFCYEDETGTKKRKTFSGKSKKQIRDQLDLWRQQSEEAPKLDSNNKHLVTQVLQDILLFKQNLRLHTYEWYENNSKKIQKLLADVYIEDMDNRAVQEFVSHLEYKENRERYSEVSIKAAFKIFKMIYEEALDKGYQVPRVNFRKINLPEGEAHDPHDKNLSDEELGILFHAVEGNAKYNTLVRVLTGTGLRIGEALALKWTDIDFDHGRICINKSLTEEKTPDQSGKNQITVVIGKTKTSCSKRDIYVPDEVLKILKEWKRSVEQDKNLMAARRTHGTENMVFTDQNGNLQKYNTLQNHFREYLKRHNVTFKMTFHMLRHVYASKLNENGADSAFIQLSLGHTDVGTTIANYITQTDKSKRRAFEEQREMLNQTLSMGGNQGDCAPLC